LNGLAYEVVGIAPPGFHDGPAEQEFGEPVDAWLPLGLAHRVLGQFGPTDRAGAILWGIGRRKPGITLEQTRADIAAIGERMGRIHPETDRGFGLVARSLKDQLVGELYAPVRILAAGAAIILLIGCGNATNLLLARLIARRRELALRRALGATRRRLVSQIVAESLGLAGLGGAIGVVLSAASIAALRRFASGLPAVVEIRESGATLLVSILLTVSTGVLVGLGGAALASRSDRREDLGSGFRDSGGRRRSGARALVMAEVALALVLMAGAGLLARSLHNLVSADLGFRTQDLLTMRVDLRGERYAEEATRARFARELVDDLSGRAGVGSVTLWGPSMLGRATWVVETAPEEAPRDDPKESLMSWRHSVNPGALANLGIPLSSGRDFAWSDDARAPRVAIVSESTARAMWPGQDPIGKRFSSVRHGSGFTVVGVARDARHRQRLDLLDAAMGVPPSGLGPQRDIYFPYLQRANAAIVLAVRTSEPDAAARSLRAAVRSKDPALPVYDLAMLDERLSRQDRGSRVITALAASYAGVALLLAAVGLYGVLAHSVEQRTREIGIRRALGARTGVVLRNVLRDGLTMTLAGCAAGLVGALFATRMIVSLLFGVAPADPGVLIAICAILLGVAAAASWIPARRATRVDPLVALRAD
jgi:predicted permease